MGGGGGRQGRMEAWGPQEQLSSTGRASGRFPQEVGQRCVLQELARGKAGGGASSGHKSPETDSKQAFPESRILRANKRLLHSNNFLVFSKAFFQSLPSQA